MIGTIGRRWRWRGPDGSGGAEEDVEILSSSSYFLLGASPPLPRDDFVIMHGERASLDPGCNPEKEEEEEEEEEEEKACLKTEKKVYNTCIILRWCSSLSASYILLTGPFSGYVVYWY